MRASRLISSSVAKSVGPGGRPEQLRRVANVVRTMAPIIVLRVHIVPHFRYRCRTTLRSLLQLVGSDFTVLVERCRPSKFSFSSNGKGPPSVPNCGERSNLVYHSGVGSAGRLLYVCLMIAFPPGILADLKLMALQGSLPRIQSLV